ncbi:hypothetical protein KQ310_15340 [Synechococcus sp. CS-1328]|nr:hypothetical protein [Synechococcus sp. CS-1328]
MEVIIQSIRLMARQVIRVPVGISEPCPLANLMELLAPLPWGDDGQIQ